MNESAIREYIVTTFPDIGVTDAAGDSYFFTDPEKMFPFATLVTSDAHDQVSDLNRPGVYRLNIGVSKQRFAELFPGPAEHDYTALDRLMPHPVYGKMYWVCVLNPGPATMETVKQLLAEAHQTDMRQHRKQGEASS
ncbi:MAG: hypothetical protein K1X57_10370 [Gemmataceae bacterium]|nr:hypothetical protein [Gemmataceae bacterium]